MAKMDWAKDTRARLWRESAKDSWSGTLPLGVVAATPKQLNYLKVLLERNGRRAYTADELKTFTVASAARLIKEFLDAEKKAKL